ncbi:hypothetical protein BDZ89DRAFT_1128914 [Hymenopellis radicata]|nr:hypothetical protein BDZ89DRAFT_1128914 [Hymenopellis radicata]
MSMGSADNSNKPNTHFASQRATKPSSEQRDSCPIHVMPHFTRFILKASVVAETKHVPSRPPSPYPGKRNQPTTTLSSPAQAKAVPVTLVPPKLDTLDVPSR